MPDIQNRLKQHEQQISQLAGALQQLQTANIDDMEMAIPRLLQELADELQRAEKTLLELSPIKSHLLITKEAVNLSRIRGARKKISNIQSDLRGLDINFND